MNPGDTEPEVITQDLLISLVVNQGPRDEAAEYFRQDGIKLDKVKEIRIEFLNILRISFLWVLKNLVKLSLSNNVIEKIENLESLIQLKQLNLSFNRIKKIENLENLINVEILLLNSNEITVIEGLDTLKKLNILNIGNNKIPNDDHVLYLRKFDKLQSLNTKDNPCTKNEKYLEYAVALLPQLLYIQYKLISQDSRLAAMEKHLRKIQICKDAELAKSNELDAKKMLEEKTALSWASFVEFLDEDHLFRQMFENDKEGEMFRAINDATEDAFENFKKIFCDLCHELYERGLVEQEKRSSDIDSFNAAVKNGVKHVQKEIRMTMEKLVTRKKLVLKQISSAQQITKEQDEDFVEKKKNIVQTLTEEFDDLISDAWVKFMNNEIPFHRQMQDLNETLTLHLTDMAEEFLEVAQNLFAQMRNAESEDNKALGNTVSIICSDEIEGKAYTIELCADRYALNNNLAATRDLHLQVIDDREDCLVHRLKNWLQSFTDNLVKREFERHRLRVLEMLHFLESQNEEFSARQHKNLYNLDDFA